MGRITLPFRTIFKEEMKDLKSFREALLDPSRRDAFGSLKRAWSSEMGAMSYARVPSVLSLMLLTAVVDNRRLKNLMLPSWKDLKEGFLLKPTKTYSF